MGLILSMHLQGRAKDLHIFAPAALAEIIIIQLKHSRTILNYKIIFNDIDPDQIKIIYENNDLTVETIPLLHRISCTGFLFREKPKLRRINKNKLPLDFPVTQILALKNGEDIFDHNGEILYRNRELTLPPKRSRSYAYCSDTIYNEGMVEQIKIVDLLYHESTFLDDQRERARETYHSTAYQAGCIARKAKVNMLVLGHYSIRYRELEPLLEEAKEQFLNTILAIEGMDISLDE
jgi:ribonuclease Z